MTRICSIDIGKKNFSFCVEEFDKKELINLKNIHINKFSFEFSNFRIMKFTVNIKAIDFYALNMKKIDF